MNRRNTILTIMGLTLFFMVLTVLYSILVFTQGEPEALVPFMPFVFLSGFFIFLIGAMLIANSISKMIENRQDK